VRSLIFDRPLFTAFPVIAFFVIGALLFVWRSAAGIIEARRTSGPTARC
jgi:hypothetical protein